MISTIFCFVLHYTEPIGRIAPKINVADEFSVRGVRVRINHTVNIACPAMAYPAPIYRWDFLL